MREKIKDYIKNEHTFDKKTIFGIFCLLIVISGIFGWIYEFIFYYFNDGMEYFSWQGGNFLPWINIYAIGGLIVYFLTYKLRKNPLKVFFISLLSCSLVEYIGGLAIYIIGNGTRYWDYNTEIWNFGNIQGFICLRSILFFGISSLALMYIIVPLCFHLAKKLNKKLFLTISITLCAIVLFDEIYNLVLAKIFSLPTAIEVYKEIGFGFIKLK